MVQSPYRQCGRPGMNAPMEGYVWLIFSMRKFGKLSIDVSKIPHRRPAPPRASRV